MKQRIAIIGAGISGLSLARSLAPLAEVTVFEKARGVGGRMSTRYADPFYFDHGAQFFTARTPEFKVFLEPFIASGAVAPWEGKVVTLQAGKEEEKRLWFEPHYVACQNMNSLCKALAGGLRVVTNTEIAPLTARDSNGWRLCDGGDKELGVFDWVISTAPPAQTQRLFRGHLSDNALHGSAVMQGCYALMLGFRRPWHKKWIAARLQESPLAWLSVNSTKPGRDAGITCLVAHSSNGWADAHMDDDMAQAEAFLIKELRNVSGIDPHEADYCSLHRWKYAIAEKAAREVHLDPILQLASVGDWCGGQRIEDAWQASVRLLSALIKLTQPAPTSLR
ncbi:MAG: FAD-dependent oxidoreductase [Alphaproteobacteria bacterium]|nr:FAD-dependent oxidoreductase [Alphaproteobacteria bacterium]